MSADSDYARVLDQLSNARLTPYVAYVSHDTVNGMGHDSTQSRIVVRVRDGKIVSGHSHMTFDTNVYHNEDSNPVTAPIFDAACYQATGESNASYNGAPAIKLSLAPICKEPHNDDHDYAFTDLYVEPGTLRPIDAHGTIPPDNDDKNVSLTLDQRFAAVGGRVMPSSMKVDISGSGLMFWLQIHVEETYSDYRFLSSAP